MAIVWLDPGGAKTKETALQFSNVTGTTPTFDTTTSRHGGQSIVSTTTGTTSAFRNDNIVPSSGRLSFNWIYTVNPNGGGGNAPFMRLTTTGAAPTTIMSVNLNYLPIGTDQGLLLFSGATNVGVSSCKNGLPGIVASTWYRICFCWTVTSTTNYAMKVYVDGVLYTSYSQTSGGTALPSTALTEISSGASAGFAASGTCSCYYCDIYMDNDSSLTDTGDIRVTAKLPTTTLNNNWANIGTGAVNERPYSSTNGMTQTTSTANVQSYNIESASSGDVDISSMTIVGSVGWIIASSGVGGSGTPKIRYNGSDTSVTLTTSPVLYYSPYSSSSSYPTEIGMVAGGNTSVFNLYECGVVIAYTVTTASVTPYVFPTGPFLDLDTNQVGFI